MPLAPMLPVSQPRLSPKGKCLLEGELWVIIQLTVLYQGSCTTMEICAPICIRSGPTCLFRSHYRPGSTF
ncbi:uncharacterized [Tachysurus ichikawai]